MTPEICIHCGQAIGLHEDCDALRAENERLKAEKIPDLMLEALHYVDGKIDMVASHPIFNILLGETSRMFDLEGAINYLSMTGTDKKGRTFDITIQLVGGETPSQRLTRQANEIDRLKAKWRPVEEAWKPGNRIADIFNAVRKAMEE